MSTGTFGTPDYRPGRGGNFKQLGNRRDASPKTAQILGIPAQDLMDALAVAFASGCAVLMSPTSDGGAVSVTLYAGDQRHRAYATSAEEFAETLLAVRDVSEAHMVGGPSTRQNGPLRAS
jgi:hypothetical protein